MGVAAAVSMGGSVAQAKPVLDYRPGGAQSEAYWFREQGRLVIRKPDLSDRLITAKAVGLVVVGVLATTCGMWVWTLPEHILAKCAIWAVVVAGSVLLLWSVLMLKPLRAYPVQIEVVPGGVRIDPSADSEPDVWWPREQITGIRVLTGLSLLSSDYEAAVYVYQTGDRFDPLVWGRRGDMQAIAQEMREVLGVGEPG